MFTSSTSVGAATSLGGFNTFMLNNLGNLQNQLAKTLTAIGTGYRVNAAADAPAASVEISGMDARLGALTTAISNNQSSFAKLSGIDGVQKSIMGALLEVRDNAQKMIGESNPILKQVLFETITEQLTAIDTLARSAKLNGKNVLAGDGAITLGTAANSVLDMQKTQVRTARDNSYLSLAFADTQAAQQAVVSGNYTLPTGGTAAAFRITTAIGAKAIQLASGANETEALVQINQTLKSIGARAEIQDGQMYFTTDGYGKNNTIKYEDINGGILGNVSLDARGVTGSLRINAENYALNGDYHNNSQETATIKGKTINNIAATTLDLKTANGTANLAIAADTVENVVAAINGDVNVQTLGVRAEVLNDNGVKYLKFSTTETGVGAVLAVNDVAGTLFADGRNLAAATGRDYQPGNGLQVTYAKSEINVNLSFQYEKVTNNVVGGVVAPDSFALTLQTQGGARFQIGEGTGFYDRINYGFRDLTSGGLGLHKILDSGSSLYALTNPAGAVSAIDFALGQMQSDYGGLGAFMNDYLSRTNDALTSLQESVADGRGIIADTDMAAATLKVVRMQILQQANISALTNGAGYAQALTKLLPGA